MAAADPAEPPAAAAADAPDASSAEISNEEVSALLEKSTTDGAQPFDLASRRLSRTQLPMLEILGRTFAERAQAALMELLNRDAKITFDGLESAKAAELQAAMPTPAAIAVVRLKPLNGLAFVTVEPTLLLTLLDAFFGGSGRVSGDTLAAAAPSAQRFLALMLRSFAPGLTAAWALVTPVEMELVKQETNPRLAPLGAPDDLFVIAKFAVEFAGNGGRIDWLLPEGLLAPIREALAADGSKPPARAQPAWGPVLRTALLGAELETRAILAQAEISLGDLVRMVPGDIIPIDAPQHATLLAGDVPLYRGRFGLSQGHNALKILARGQS
jgi:flagellar motor switch protein FliM